MNPVALLLLVLAIAGEVIGTAGLKASEGFGRFGPRPCWRYWGTARRFTFSR